jgi:hypothetical protein
MADGHHKAVLVIETDLELDPGSERFDSSELDDLIDAAVEQFSPHGWTITRVDVVPVGAANG